MTNEFAEAVVLDALLMDPEKDPILPGTWHVDGQRVQTDEDGKVNYATCTCTECSGTPRCAHVAAVLIAREKERG